MESERLLARYVTDTVYEELPEKPVAIAKEVVLTVLGTTIAGAKAEGCEALVRQVRQWGGRKEATILIHGGKVPAHNAALVNSAMARALDFCDGMVPGMHVGSSSIPTALAAAELAGGCTGKVAPRSHTRDEGRPLRAVLQGKVLNRLTLLGC